MWVIMESHRLQYYTHFHIVNKPVQVHWQQSCLNLRTLVCTVGAGRRTDKGTVLGESAVRLPLCESERLRKYWVTFSQKAGEFLVWNRLCNKTFSSLKFSVPWSKVNAALRRLHVETNKKKKGYTLKKEDCHRGGKRGTRKEETNKGQKTLEHAHCSLPLGDRRQNTYVSVSKKTFKHKFSVHLLFPLFMIHSSHLI
jgi:hypothetical protein